MFEPKNIINNRDNYQNQTQTTEKSQIKTSNQSVNQRIEIIKKKLPQNITPKICSKQKQTLTQLKELLPSYSPGEALGQLKFPAELLECLDKKTAFQMLSDYWGRGRKTQNGEKLEGHSLHAMLNYMQRLVAFNGKNEILISHYKQAAEIAEKLNTLTQEEFEPFIENYLISKLKELTPNSMFFIPIGWSGLVQNHPFIEHTGHAMMLQIVKMESGEFVLRVLNTGSGLELFHQQKVFEVKRKFNPFCEWPVSFEQLESATLWKNLLEPRLIPKWYPEKRPYFSKENIYLPLEKHLGPPFVKKNLSDDSFITSQRAGTCSKKCPDLISRLFLEKSDYKKYKIESNLLTLAMLHLKWNQPQDELYHDSDILEIMSKGIEGLEGALLRAIKNKEFSKHQNEQEDAIALLIDLVEAVQGDTFLQKTLHSNVDEYSAIGSAQFCDTTIPENAKTIDEVSEMVFQRHGKQFLPSINGDLGFKFHEVEIKFPTKNSEVKGFLDSLEVIADNLTFFEQRPVFEAAAFIQKKIIGPMPIPSIGKENQYDIFSKEEALRFCLSLRMISNHFIFWTMGKAKRILPEHTATFWKIYAIGIELAVKANPTLKGQKFNWSNLKQSLNSRRFIIDDEADRLQFEQLEKLFNSHSPGGGDISTCPTAPFFAFYLMKIKNYSRPRKEFIQWSEWRWLESQLSGELLNKLKSLEISGSSIETLVTYLTKQNFKKGVPAYIPEYIALRDMAFYALSSCQMDGKLTDYLERKLSNDYERSYKLRYFSDYHSQCFLDLNENIGFIVFKSGKEAFKSVNLDKTWVEKHKFPKEFTLTDYAQDLLEKEALKQPEIWRRSKLESKRREVAGISTQTSYDFSIINEAPEKTRLPLLCDLIEKEPQHLHDKDFRLYFLYHLFESGRFNDQAIHEPEFLNRFYRLLESLLHNGQRDLTNGLSLKLWEHDLYIFKIALAVLRLSPPESIKDVKALIERYQDNLIHYILKNKELLKQQEEEELLGSISHHILAAWEGWPLECGLPQNYLNILKIAGRNPLRGIWEDPRFSQQVQNVLLHFYPILSIHPKPAMFLEIFLEDFNESHLAEYPISTKEASEKKEVLELRLKRTTLMTWLKESKIKYESCKEHIKALEARKQTGYEINKWTMDYYHDSLEQTLETIQDYDSQIQKIEVTLSEMGASIEQILPKDIWIVSFPLFSLAHNSGTVVQVDVVQGKVYHDGIEEIGSALPTRIKEAPFMGIFKNLLSKPTNRVGNCYTFVNPFLSHISIINDEAMSVDMRWEGKKYTLLMDREQIKLKVPHLFKQSYLTYWIDSQKGGQILIGVIDNQGIPIPVFIMDSEGNVYRIGNRNLSLINIRNEENAKALGLFSRLCPDLNDVLAWKGNDNKLQRVELPCTTDSTSWLAFIKIEGEEGWFWETDPNYKIIPSQHMPYFGSYSYFLVLENEDGERLVLINPILVDALKERKKGYRPMPAESINLSTHMSPNGHPPENLIRYAVNSSGEPIPMNITGTLYLAYLNLLESKYAVSLDLLRQSTPMGRKYTVTELDLLKWIIDSQKEKGDRHPGACAVRIFAAAKAIDHLKVFPLEKKGENDMSYEASLYGFFSGSELTTILNEAYGDYSGQSHVSMEWRLDKILTVQEQSNIISLLPNMDHSHNFLAGKIYPLSFIHDKIPLHTFADLTLKHKDVAFFEGEIDETDVEEKLFKHQTWGGIDFSKIFWYAYNIAINKYNDPNKAQKLKEMLQFRMFDFESSGFYKESDKQERIEKIQLIFGGFIQFPISETINQGLYRILNRILDAKEVASFPLLPSRNCPEIKRSSAKREFFESIKKLEVKWTEASLSKFHPFVSPIPENIKLPQKTEERLLDYHKKMMRFGLTGDWKMCFAHLDCFYDPIKRNHELLQECKDFPEIVILLEDLGALYLLCANYKSDKFEPPKEWALPIHGRPPIINESKLGFFPSLSSISGMMENVERKEAKVRDVELISSKRKEVLSIQDRECLIPLEEAIHAFNMEKGKYTYTIDQKHCDELSRKVEARREELTVKAKSLKKQILKLANSIPESWAAEQKFEHFLARLKGAKPTFDINACVGLALQGLPIHWEEMVGIAEHERNDFIKLVAEYLIYKTEIQLCERAEKKIRDLSSAKIEEEKMQLAQEIGQMLDSKRDYDCMDNFVILVYEYFGNIRLFPKQVKVIQLLAKVQYAMTPTERHRVAQLIMGAGKSQVLSPILAFLAADGEHISTITATDQLYGTSKHDWSQKIYQMFRRHSEVLEFNRENCTIEQLTRIRSMLTKAKREGRVVITRPNDLLSLRMMLIEHLEQIRLIKTRYAQKCGEWIKLNDRLIKTELHEILFAYLTTEKDASELYQKLERLENDVKERIKAIKAGQANLIEECNVFRKEMDELCAILLDLNENQVNLIDEFDSVSHPLTQLSFPIGFSKKVQTEAIEVATDLYFDWLTEKEDLLHISEDAQSAFCTTENLKEVLSFLIDMACKSEGNLVHEEIWKSYLRGEDTKETRQLYEEMKQKAETIEFKPRCERFSFMKHVITHELAAALRSIAHAQYGLSERDLDYQLVIPCEKGEKKEGARYRNPYETLLKTCQFYRQSWQRPDITKQLLEYYLKELEIQPIEPAIISEIKTAFGLKQFNKLPVEDDQYILEKTKTFEYYLKSKKIEDKERHEAALKVVKTYLRDVIFPSQLTYDPVQANGTPLDLADIPNSNKGYSGTFANDKTWDTKIDTIPDLETDGATASALLDPRNMQCLTLKGTTFEEKVAGCAAEIKNFPETSSLIDLGAIFRGQPPKKVVSDLLNQMKETEVPKTAVISYQKNNQKEWAITLWRSGAEEPLYIDGSNEEDIKRACLGIPRDQILTNYDYPHIIGANIVQPLFSRAIVTLGDKTTIDHHLQAVMRMRKLGELAHFVTFLLTKEVEDCIKDRLKISSDQRLTGQDLLQYTQIQLKETEKPRNYQAIRKQLLQVLKNNFLHQIIRAKNNELREQIYEPGRPYLIHEQGGSLFQQFGQIERKSEPWNVFTQDLERLEKVIPEKSVSDQLNGILQLHKQRKTPLPDEVTEFMMTEQESVEVQSQAQMRVQQKMRQEEAEMREVEKMVAIKDTPWPKFIGESDFIPKKSLQEIHSDKPTVFSLITACENIDNLDLHSLSLTFDKLYVTSNFIRSFVGKGNTFLTRLGNQIHHILVVKGKSWEYSDAKFICVTLEESDYFIRCLQNKKYVGDFFVIESFGETVQNGAVKWQNPFDNPNRDNKVQRIALIQAMVMQGDARRLKEARYYLTLKEWVGGLDENQRKNVKLLFEQSLSFRSDDKKIYDRTIILQKIWQ